MTTATTDVVEEVRLISTNLDKNSNKYWHGQIIKSGGQYEFQVHFGRVGYEGTPKTVHTGDLGSCQRKLNSKAASKKKGKTDKATGKKHSVYVEQKTLGGTSKAKATAVKGATLKKVAIEQIKTNDPEVTKLVKTLAETNVHNILKATTLEYDDTTGQFATPLGIVTQDAIDEARKLLGKIGGFIAKDTFGNKAVSDSLAEYLQLIPTKVKLGRKTREQFVREVLPNLNAVQAQNSILDSLQASLEIVLTSKPKAAKKKDTKQPKLFDVSLHLVKSRKLFGEIVKKYNKTRKNMHQCHHLDVKKVFKVEIGHMAAAFAKRGAKMANIWQLWHGTQVSNLLSILHKGFFIPPAQAKQCTGRMYGDGIYGSDISTKALNYAYGYWSGGRNDNCYMFLVDFAMGKYYTPRGATGRLPRPGYDSTYAKEGVSGVYNNEMIVYNTNQINPVYLVLFGR
jgi:poly [ADP-ribose] polymerase